MIDKIKALLRIQRHNETETHKPMADAEFVEYHQKLYAELSDEVKRQGMEILRTYLPKNDLPLIAGQIREYGTVVWMSKFQEHFGWGMVVRNLLRQHGLKDDVLATRNWDDYYVLLVEDACKCK